MVFRWSAAALAMLSLLLVQPANAAGQDSPAVKHIYVMRHLQKRTAKIRD